MDKVKTQGNFSFFPIFLAFAISFPFLLANCSSSSSDKTDTVTAAPDTTRYLYVATAKEDENLLVRIDTATNTVLNQMEIGFTPSFPANQLNDGTIFWGTASNTLFGFDVATGASVTRTAWESYLALRILADAYEYLIPAKATANAKAPSCSVGATEITARSVQATGVTLGGGGSWTAITKDGKNIWTASWGTSGGAAASGIHTLHNTSGASQLTVNPVTGQTIDMSGNVLFDFASQYAADGGSMPGGNEGLGAGDVFTQASPCDVSISEINGTEYAWGVDVNGDTITGYNASTGEIVGQMIYKPLGPDQESHGFIAPFMNTAGSTADGTAINTTENLAGARSESIVDVSDPASPRELVRIYVSFTDADSAAWDFSSGALANYSDVSSSHSSKLSGAISTKIYEWASPDAGYPQFITDGLTAGTTSEIDPQGRFAYIWGSPISVVDLTGSAPWVVSNEIELTTGGGGVGTFNVDGSRAYVGTAASGAGSLPVIDTSTHTVIDLIPITGRARGMAMM